MSDILNAKTFIEKCIAYAACNFLEEAESAAAELKELRAELDALITPSTAGGERATIGDVWCVFPTFGEGGVKWRTMYLEGKEINSQLRAELAAKDAALEVGQQLYDGITALKKLLSADGDYSICKSDGRKMWLGDDLVVGGVMERIDNALDAWLASQQNARQEEK